MNFHRQHRSKWFYSVNLATQINVVISFLIITSASVGIFRYLPAYNPNLLLVEHTRLVPVYKIYPFSYGRSSSGNVYLTAGVPPIFEVTNSDSTSNRFWLGINFIQWWIPL